MEKERIPKDMTIQLRAYFLHARDLLQHKYFSRVVSTLSPGLRDEMLVFLSGEWIHNVPFFVGGPKAEHARFITEISPHLEPRLFPPQELIIRSGDPTDAMYIISKGLAARLGKIFRKGHFVGDDFILSNGIRHYEVRTLTYVDAYSLERKDLIKVLASNRFPYKVKKIKRAAALLSLARKIQLYFQELQALKTTEAFTKVEETSWLRARMLAFSDGDEVSSICHANVMSAIKNATQALDTLETLLTKDLSLKRAETIYPILTFLRTSVVMLSNTKTDQCIFE